MSVDTTHTTKEQLEKIGMLIEHCKHLGGALKDLKADSPGEVRTLLNLLRFNGETLIDFANEADACAKALVIKNFIETVPLPDIETYDDPCPDCGTQLRAKTMGEGGGTECPAKDCGYWFCF